MNNPTPLDPQLVNLAKAIRQTESGGNFTAQGKSGEYGAYQFTQPTWNAASKAFGVNVPLAQATPEQQNEVAYQQLASWKQANPNWNIGNFASAWNAGAKNPDAYLNNNVGTNSSGVHYDTGAYAKSVATAYQTIKQGGAVGIDPNNPSSVGASQPQDQGQPSVGGFVGNVFSSAGNLIGGLANAAMHPIDTASNLLSMAGGAVETGANALGITNINNKDTQNFSNLVGYFGKRYGGSSPSDVVHNIGHTLYTDPVGAALDLSTFLDGAGAAVG